MGHNSAGALLGNWAAGRRGVQESKGTKGEHKAVLLGHARHGWTRGLECIGFPTSSASWSSSLELEWSSFSGFLSRSGAIILNHESSVALIILPPSARYARSRGLGVRSDLSTR